MQKGDFLFHKFTAGITIELLETTERGWKVEQTESYQPWGKQKLRTPKVKTTFYSTAELKELFS